MHCSKCKDERVIWETGDFGMAICKPCPECNREGIPVQSEQIKIDREKEKESHGARISG